MKISNLKPGSKVYTWILDNNQTEPIESIIQGISFDKKRIITPDKCYSNIDPSKKWSTTKSTFTFENLLDIIAVSREDCINGYSIHCKNLSDKWLKESSKYKTIEK